MKTMRQVIPTPNQRLQPTARGGILSAPRLNRRRSAMDVFPGSGPAKSLSEAYQRGILLITRTR
jgi:hypothetical protein